MTIKKITVGMWVNTNVGAGRVERVGGTHPPTVRVRIVAPLPRGIVYVAPRDVARPLTDDEIAEIERLADAGKGIP